MKCSWRYIIEKLNTGLDNKEIKKIKEVMNSGAGLITATSNGYANIITCSF